MFDVAFWSSLAVPAPEGFSLESGRDSIAGGDNAALRGLGSAIIPVVNFEPAGERLIGRRLLRQEDPRLVTGRGAYVTDLAMPGTLHMAVLRSSHAHARIARVDVDRARGVPGVVAVFTAGDLRDVGPLPVLAHPPGQRQTGFPVLPSDRARHRGQALPGGVG